MTSCDFSPLVLLELDVKSTPREILAVEFCSARMELSSQRYRTTMPENGGT